MKRRGCREIEVEKRQDTRDGSKSSSDRGTIQVFTFDLTISTCGTVHVYRMTPSQHTPHLPRGEPISQRQSSCTAHPCCQLTTHFEPVKQTSSAVLKALCFYLFLLPDAIPELAHKSKVNSSRGSLCHFPKAETKHLYLM